MAYSGTTAASSLQNPPILLVRGLGQISSTLGAVIGSTASTNNAPGGSGLWYYSSTDTSTLLQAPGYFTDGLRLGMRQGDVIMNVFATALGTSPSAVQVGCIVTTNSTAGFNVAIGAAIASS